MVHYRSFKRKLMSYLNLALQLKSGILSKSSGMLHSYRLTRHKQPLMLEQAFTENLNQLFRSSQEKEHTAQAQVTPSDLRLCERIHIETTQHNRNNITRTQAYWDIYKAYPELHWAFLAHMVSRNGGWSMTDLKGQWLPELLDPVLIRQLFRMLEACNSLIFGDAYPQLRLYVESRRIDRSLTHLLPQFGVSSFMAPFWDQFWIDRKPVPLTVALIMNEQHFIQLRVIEKEYYQTNVFNSLVFRSQPFLQMNQILFPMSHNEGSKPNSPLRLVGRILENFVDLQERIAFGKSLYALLYRYPDVHGRIVTYCEQAHHTGSRADYWPQYFTARNNKTGDSLLESELTAGPPMSSLWYSPSLTDAWPELELAHGMETDWFQSLEDVTSASIHRMKLPWVIDMTHEHLFGQNKLQAAVLLERSFMKGASKRRTGRG